MSTVIYKFHFSIPTHFSDQWSIYIPTSLLLRFVVSFSENDSSSSVRCETDSRDTRVSDQKQRSFGLKALQSENTYTVQESTSTVYQTTSEQKGGVDQLITDHKGKPLFGLKALQSIGKNEEEPIYDDMPESPVSPQLKDLVLKHEKHASKFFYND